VPVHWSEVDTRLAAYALITDADGRVLLTWFNGEGRAEPAWSMPGGGIDYGESVVEGLEREVHEETGYAVEVGAPILVDTFHGVPSQPTGRPFRAVRVLYDATITGGELGTVEVGGSTDFARWLRPEEAAAAPSRSGVVDLALAVLRER
jgi:8-oxo-dGTP diphosphatase